MGDCCGPCPTSRGHWARSFRSRVESSFEFSRWKAWKSDGCCKMLHSWEFTQSAFHNLQMLRSSQENNNWIIPSNVPSPTKVVHISSINIIMPKILNALFYLLYFKLSMKIYLIKIKAPKLIYWSILVAFFFPGWCDDINCYPFVYWVNGLRLLSCEVYLPGEWNLQYTLQKRERSFLVCWLYSVNKNW